MAKLIHGLIVSALVVINQNYLFMSFRYDFHTGWSELCQCAAGSTALHSCLTSVQDRGTRGSVTCGEQLASRLQRGPDRLPEAPRGQRVIHRWGSKLTRGTSPVPPCGQHHTLRPPHDLEQSLAMGSTGHLSSRCPNSLSHSSPKQRARLDPSLQQNGWAHTWSWWQLLRGWTLSVQTVWRE